MANLTITVDGELLKRARIRALQLGTSVNAMLRDRLEAFAGEEEGRADAIRTLLRQSRKARTARGGRRWTREELHER